MKSVIITAALCTVFALQPLAAQGSVLPTHNGGTLYVQPLPIPFPPAFPVSIYSPVGDVKGFGVAVFIAADATDIADGVPYAVTLQLKTADGLIGDYQFTAARHDGLGTRTTAVPFMIGAPGQLAKRVTQVISARLLPYPPANERLFSFALVSAR